MSAVQVRIQKLLIQRSGNMKKKKKGVETIRFLTVENNPWRNFVMLPEIHENL